MARKARYIDGSVIKPATIPSDAFEAGALGTTSIADLSVTTAKLAASAVTTAKLADQNITAAKLSNTSITGSLAGIPVVWEIEVAGTTANYDVVVSNKCRITDLIVLKAPADGGAGTTIQLKTSGGAANITNALDLNTTTDGAVVRASTIDLANRQVAAGTTLRLAATQGAGSCACVAIVKGIWVA